MKGLSEKWQKLIVWMTGYLNIIAFVIAGGYLFKNTESESVKKSAKVALIVTAIFTAIGIATTIISNTVALVKPGSAWISEMLWVIAIVKAVVYVVLFIVDMTVGFGSAKSAQNTESNNQDGNAE